MHCDIPICCKVGHWHFQSVRLRVCPSSSVLSLLSIIALILDLPSISAFVSHGQSFLGSILYSNHRTVLQWQSFGLSSTLYILAVKSYLIHWISSYCFIVLESVMQPWTFLSPFTYTVITLWVFSFLWGSMGNVLHCVDMIKNSIWPHPLGRWGQTSGIFF